MLPVRQRVYFPLSAALLALVVVTVGFFADGATAATKKTTKAPARSVKPETSAAVTTTTWPGQLVTTPTGPSVSVVATIAIPGAQTTLPILTPDPTIPVIAVQSPPPSGPTASPGRVVTPDSGPPTIATAATVTTGAPANEPVPTLVDAPSAPSTTQVPMKRIVEIAGHGYGHGRGLGQWGAFGYATDYGWSAAQILSHYYPGTGAGKVAPTSAIGVRLVAQEGKTLTVFQPKGLVYFGVDGGPLALAGSSPSPAPAGSLVPTKGAGEPTVPVPSGFSAAAPVAAGVTAPPETVSPPMSPAVPDGPAAVRITVTKGGFSIADGPACDGPFVARGTPILGAAIVVSTDIDRRSQLSSDPSDLLSLCTKGGRTVYRGDLLAVDGTAAGQPGLHAVNQVSLESYLRSVVPSEVPKTWGSVKGGFEALKAQAVAARSYAAAERRTGYSNTCDTTSCQVYKGRGEYRGGGFATFEDARTDQAVADTAGEIRVEPKTGAPIRTEFSSSTGGYSAPGEIASPVPDDGDATVGNPYKSWSVIIDASRLDSKLGALSMIEPTKRDGFGPDGGRVQELTLHFTNGTSTISGSDLASRFGLRSTLFNAQVKLVPIATPESKLADAVVVGDDPTTTDPTTSLPKRKVTKPPKDPVSRKATTTITVKRPTG